MVLAQCDEPRCAPPQHDATEDNARYRQHRDNQRDQVDLAIDLDLGRLAHILDTLKHGDVEDSDRSQTADNRDAAEGLHGRVHELDIGFGVGIAMFVNGWHRLDRHCVGDDILNHVTGWRQQRGGHEPGLRAHNRCHRLEMHYDAVHDQQAGGDQCGTDIHQ